MLAPTHLPRARRAATTVEMAFVLAIFILFFFGLMEYCRFVYVRQMLVNSAREGCRFAVVEPMSSTLEADTEVRVRKYLSGIDKTHPNFKCQVYLSDTSGNNIGKAADAQFAQLIAVDLEVDYSPFLPNILFLNNTYKLKSKCIMASEAN
jgi:hypothetical protein